MNKVNIILISTTTLKNREKYINSTLNYIINKFEELKIVTEVKIINTPTCEYISKNIESYNKRVQYDKTELIDDIDFKKLIVNLNPNQISNIEKHVEAYKLVLDDNELYFIIEDDVLIGEDYTNNIEELFKQLVTKGLNDWDILFTTNPHYDNDKILKLKDSHESNKILLSKSSYLIKSKLALELKEYLNIFKYNLKHSISRYIWDNKDRIKAKVLNKNTFLEGSKIGLFHTSTNNNNFLYQNNNFIELVKIANNNNITDDMFIKAIDIYKKIEYLDNADIIHTMGVVFYKRNDINKAKEFMTNAAIKLYNNYGYISKNNDIINNAINIHQKKQIYLEECKMKKSKYS
tara:strand:+ start:3822 stop:4865 length:1044 start_codon:yes stop_codon:yes gene_type:complete